MPNGFFFNEDIFAYLLGKYDLLRMELQNFNYVKLVVT